ncbi:MAG: toll/interleukin-1 receptor domain-containing protein [Pseudonocardiaceae bacterium]
MRWREDTSGTRAGASSLGSDLPIDFFISYSPADERWATWIAWQLEAAGHRTLLQSWNFVPGTNFIDFMDRGVRDSAVVVAVAVAQLPQVALRAHGVASCAAHRPREARHDPH